MSADGNTLVFSGATDGTSGQGAVWVIDIENQTYEQISKITLSGTTGFGSGLALSSNGNTMACGSIGETDIYI